MQNTAVEKEPLGAESQSKLSSSKRVPRTITRSLKIHETSEGIGSKTRRCIGNRSVRCLPPFVICEQFKMGETGRPPHPSRGAQKITYVLAGRVRLEYSPDNSIELGPGDVTSLMVGRGVIRSTRAVPDPDNEPRQKKCNATGIQIFMDVPEPFKRINPSHLNLCHSDIVTCEPSTGCLLKVLTGSVFGKKANQMLTATPALMLDCKMDPGSSVDIPVKLDWNAFAYVIEGPLHIQGEKANKYRYVEFMRSPRSNQESAEESGQTSSKSDSKENEGYVNLAVDAASTQTARVLFCAAKPLCQPIYRQGPFVDVSMNWIHQAFDDYTERKNGFESGEWNSHRRKAYAAPSSSGGWGSAEPQPVSSKPKDPCSDSSKESSCDNAASCSCSKEDSKSHTKAGENSPPYNPCDDDNAEGSNCKDTNESHQTNKASFPNAFPPGSVNPASHSSAFNGTECVEKQQEEKLPGQPEASDSRKRRRPSESYESETSDTAGPSTPPQKK